jgi:hypothetical protein
MAVLLIQAEFKDNVDMHVHELGVVSEWNDVRRSEKLFLLVITSLTLDDVAVVTGTTLLTWHLT